MARPLNPRCVACVQLSVAEARQQECWVESRCHRKRSHYRHRDRLRRKAMLQRQQPAIQTPAIAPPQSYAAFLVLYRSGSTAPVHAIAAEIWQGDTRIGLTPTIHTFGLKAIPQTQGGQRIEPIQTVIAQLLATLREPFSINAFEWDVIERPPAQCPLRPCPLHPTDDEPLT